MYSRHSDDETQGPTAPRTSGSPSGSSSTSLCDGCGASATYSEAISTSGGYSKRTITSTGCPNHYSLCTGKSSLAGCGGIGAEGTASEARDQNKVIEIPAEPVIATTSTDMECAMGDIAVALNGVSIYSGAVDTSCELLDVTDSTSEWTSFDYCSGHSERTGDYHYHFPPSCLLTQAGESLSSHSPQIGWSYDGFPIYGPRTVNGNLAKHCSQDPTDEYCLDGCSGLEIELPSIDSFKYRYYMTGSISDLKTLPSNPKPASSDYPFTIKCYKGCTWSELSGDDSKCTGGSSGVTSSYSPTATRGYTDQYVSPEAAACKEDDDSDSGEIVWSDTTTIGVMVGIMIVCCCLGSIAYLYLKRHETKCEEPGSSQVQMATVEKVVKAGAI